MSKELIISVTPQETKAAIFENDQVSEIYIERYKEHGVVGSICKGKVTKVLPGMQSAFVDIGLERDAFLYVSDFFEDTEEYDKIVSTAEDQVAKLQQEVKDSVAPAQESIPASSGTSFIAPNVVKYHDRRGRSRRSRRNRLRGKRYDDATHSPSETRVVSQEAAVAPPAGNVEAFPSVLPGESLAKYQKPTAGPLDQQAPVPDGSPEISAAPGASDLAGVKREADITNTAKPQDNVLSEGLPVGTDLSPDLGSETTERPSHIAQSPLDRAQAIVAEEAVASVLPGDVSPFDYLSSESGVDLSEAKAPESGTVSESEKQEALEKAMASSSPQGTQPEFAVPPSTNETRRPLGSSAPNKIQFRNPPNTSRFLKRNLRKRHHNNGEDGGEVEGAPDFPLIGDLLKEGQEILVQISKEPLGTKGARITSHIALPGRYLVYMPTVDHIGVSRKIDSEEERQRLKRIIQENRGALAGGFIVRTAGQNKGEEEFKSDIKYLSALWSEIRSKADKKSAPAIIHRDLSLIQRLLRDHLSGDFSAIRVDNEVEYAAMVEFISRFQPSVVNRVKLYQKETPIFEEFGVQTEIDKALRSKVWLKSGGYIVIDQVEALVAIDVNTGKYVGKSNKLEDTIVKTNIEAAKEIARQIRLRDLGGIIVCDFIDMEDRKNRQKVTQTLEEALRSDKSPSKILQFNDFGLVAITRKRVKQSLLKVLCEPCSECGGSGMVKSPQTVCYEIQGEIKKMAKLLDNREITIRANPEVAKALKTAEASVINEIEASLKKEVIIKSDPQLHQEHFDIF
jgi:Rne/Rng family ribonuclease